ncbi:MAG: hypothetical protein U0Q18_28410 [Bryobacteraceae bacterium]
MKLELTVDEIALLTSLAADQLFRREFIDPKMPGYKADPVQVRVGKALVKRLQLLIGQGHAERGSSEAAMPEGVSGTLSKRIAGSTDAL